MPRLNFILATIVGAVASFGITIIIYEVFGYHEFLVTFNELSDEVIPSITRFPFPILILHTLFLEPYHASIYIFHGIIKIMIIIFTKAFITSLLYWKSFLSSTFICFNRLMPCFHSLINSLISYNYSHPKSVTT